MLVHIIKMIEQELDSQAGRIFSLIVPVSSQVELSIKPSYGDLSTNVAFQLSRTLGNPPEKLARILVDAMDVEKIPIEKIEIVSPGFINFYLKPDWKINVLTELQNISRQGIKPKTLDLKEEITREDLYNLKQEINYIIFRVQWILDRFQEEGICPRYEKIQWQDPSSSIEQDIIEELLYFVENIKKKDKLVNGKEIYNRMESLKKVFYRYHNSLILRNLEEDRCNVTLSLMEGIKKAFEQIKIIGV